MSESSTSLQFDTAEPVAPAAADVRCAACGDALASYFEVNGAVACGRCKDTAVTARGGSHAGSLLRATGLGLVAAALGAAVYYAVAALTGYEIGLISIAVGLLVGFAVRKGSRGRGGWRYQALAMFLTYAAIASTYVPRVFQAAKEQERSAATVQTPAPAAAPLPAEAPASGAPATAPTPEAAPVGLGAFLGAVGMLLALSLALPFLAGFDNVMGLVLIAIGLYEAWKVNRLTPFSVTGPYQVGAARAADA